MSIGIFPNVNSSKIKSGYTFGEVCSFPHWKVEEQPNRKPKNGDDRSAVVMVKSVRQLGCVSQDAKPPESGTISRKGKKKCWIHLDQYDSRGLRCVKQTSEKKKVRRLGKYKSNIFISEVITFCQIDDRSPEETARQKRCARGDV